MFYKPLELTLKFAQILFCFVLAARIHHWEKTINQDSIVISEVPKNVYVPD